MAARTPDPERCPDQVAAKRPPVAAGISALPSPRWRVGCAPEDSRPASPPARAGRAAVAASSPSRSGAQADRGRVVSRGCRCGAASGSEPGHDWDSSRDSEAAARFRAGFAPSPTLALPRTRSFPARRRRAASLGARALGTTGPESKAKGVNPLRSIVLSCKCRIVELWANPMSSDNITSLTQALEQIFWNVIELY